MKDFFKLTTPAKCFRFIAVIEAVTWAALIVAMIVKRVADMDSAIRVPGMAHGVAFVAYVLIALWATKSLGWWRGRPPLRLRVKNSEIAVPVVLLALVASIPPFFTIWFEVWARRNGHLGELSDTATARGGGDVDRDKLIV